MLFNRPFTTCIWRERNNRRHREAHFPATHIIQYVDKNVRNRLSSIRIAGDHSYDERMILWFATQNP